MIRHIAFTHKGHSFVSPQKDPLKIDTDEGILILRRKVADCLAKDKTKNKIFLCEQCDAKFANNDNLQRHVRQVHLGELIVCSFCPYKSKEKRVKYWKSQRNCYRVFDKHFKHQYKSKEKKSFRKHRPFKLKRNEPDIKKLVHIVVKL